MLRKLILVVGLLCAAWLPANAQQAQPIASCGTLPTPLGTSVAHVLYMDINGSLCTSGSGGGGGGLSVTDSAAWTAASSAFTPTGGVFNDSATALTAGQQGTARLNAKREMHIDCDITNVLCGLIAGPTPASTNRIGYVSDDPCNSKIKLNAPFSTTSGGPVSLIALSGSTVIYVCSISAITDTAIKLSFIDGTGGSCAAAQHAIWGSTTAASGMSLAANGGFTQGSGNGSVGVTTAASALCLLQSGTSLVAGNVTYVQQ